jgi:hypothetical protein
MPERPVSQRAEHPEHRFRNREGVGREVEDQRHQRACEGRDRDARKDQGQRSAPRPRQRKDQEDGDQGAGQGGEGQCEREAGGETGLSAITAPSAAEPETPISPGSANGLRR